MVGCAPPGRGGLSEIPERADSELIINPLREEKKKTKRQQPTRKEATAHTERPVSANSGASGPPPRLKEWEGPAREHSGRASRPRLRASPRGDKNFFLRNPRNLKLYVNEPLEPELGSELHEGRVGQPETWRPGICRE